MLGPLPTCYGRQGATFLPNIKGLTVKVLFITLDWPPMRFIGSEIYDRHFAAALIKDGNEVDVVTLDHKKPFTADSVNVNQNIQSYYDVVITHLESRDKAWGYCYNNGIKYGSLNGIQHNDGDRTLMNARLYVWDNLIFNAEFFKTQSLNMQANKHVIYPHVPKVSSTPLSSGDRVTLINLNANKIGPFWDLAASMPHVKFTGVIGGYGKQLIPDVIPSNVEIIDHQKDLTKVWERTRLLLLPSHKESWGMVASEALRHGIHTIASEHLEGVKENLGKTAIYLPKDNAVELWMHFIDNAPNPSKMAQDRARELVRITGIQTKNAIKTLKE